MKKSIKCIQLLGFDVQFFVEDNEEGAGVLYSYSIYRNGNFVDEGRGWPTEASLIDHVSSILLFIVKQDKNKQPLHNNNLDNVFKL